MPLTKEQERSFLASKGYNPDDYTLVETPDSYELKPLIKTQPTAISQPFGVTEQAQQSNLPQDQAPKPDDSMSGLRAFATTAGRGAIPAIAGLGAMAAIPTGGLSLLPSLLLAGTAGGLASYGAAKLQEPLLENTPLSQSMAQQAEQAHPYAALAGSVAPNLIAMKPAPGLAMQAGQSAIRGLSGKALSNLERANLQNVVAGAILPAASNAYQSIAETGQMPSATDLMRDAALGALISNPNALGRKVFGMHEMPSNVLPYDPRAQGNQQLRGEQMPLQEAAPTQQPISTPIDSMLAARNKVLAENVYPLTNKGIKRAERAQEGVVANWHLPEEPGYAQQTMEGEGAPPTKESDMDKAQKEWQLRQADFQKAKEEVRVAQVNQEAELLKQKAEELRQMFKQGKTLDTTENRPALAAENPDTSLELPKDYTGNLEQDNAQVAKESPADLASRQEEAQLSGESKPKYQAAEQKRISVEEAPEQLSGVPKALVESMKRLGLTRNIQVDTTSGKLYNDRGVEINGKAWMENGLRKVVAQVGQGAKLDTLPHEITHHWFDDLATSPRKQDQALRQRVLDKVAQHPDYLAYKAENPSMSPEEYMVQATGERTINDIRNSDSSLWKDLVSSVKARYSSQPKIADLARHLSSRVLTDASHSEVYGEGLKNPRVAMVDTNEKDQTAESPDVAKQKDIARHREIWDTIISNTAKDPEFAFSQEGQNLWKESEAIKNKYGGHVPGKEQPKDQPFVLSESANEKTFRPTSSAITKLRTEVKDERASKLADAFTKTLIEKQALMADWWNPVAQAANKLTPEQASRVNEALVKARDTQTNVASSLPTLAETQAYNVAQAALKRTREYQQANNIPVYDTNGNPKKAGLDENYYPTTGEVADTIKEGTDAQAIGQLRGDFIKKQMEGFKGKKVSEEEASARYEKLVSAIRGDAMGVGGKTTSSTAFGAIRKVEGIPLPDSWRNNKLRDNLFSYFNRASTDLSFAKHVESNPEVAKALGYKQDLWGKDLGPSQGESLAGNEHVRNVLDSIQGKASLHDSISMKEAAYESAASSFMIGGPLREIHVVGSSIANAFSYAKPAEALQTVAKGITQFVKGWETTLQTGASIEPKSADPLRMLMASDSSGADRVKAVSQMVRQISTLGGLTNRFSKGLLQVSGETIAEQRLATVANGSGQVKQDAISYLKAIDPDYVEGKTYDQQGIQKLGSGFVDLIHGTYDARTLPNWMLKDTAVSAFFKMASWNIAQTNNFMKHVWTPATQGNFTPLLMATLGSVAGGALIKELREQVADKKAPYPSIKEVLAANEGKLDEHGIPLVAYNLMGMASFAGYAGILSSVAKSGFDVMYKNAPQGATFPLDEVVSNTAGTLANMLQAFKEGDDSFVNIGLKATEDLFKQNSQLLRIASTWVDKSGLGGEDEKFKHQKTIEEADLRRFEEAKGIPYQAQTGSAPTNPYLNLKAERFKNNPDIEESLKELPGLIENIVNRYADNPEILKSKLEGLKGSLSYKTMPNVEQDVYSFAKYYEYLEATKGKQEAAKILDNYMKNKLVNGIKSEVVPVF